MLGFKIKGSDGRYLTIRPCHGGDGVQLGILGKRGSLVEAIPIGLDQVPTTLACMDEVLDVAWARFQRSTRPVEPEFDRVPV
jgi:hypothetical protein